MPVVLLLDNSLSMRQNVPSNHDDNSGFISRDTLAVSGLTAFLNYQAKHNPLDLTAFYCFSQEARELVKFTRDFEALEEKLSSLKSSNSFGGKSNLINALRDVSKVISEEWGSSDTTHHVLVVTTGNALLNASFLSKSSSLPSDANDIGEGDSSKWPLPLPFRSKIHIICMTTLNDSSFQRSLPFYKEVILRNSTSKSEVTVNSPCEGGQIWVPNGPSLSPSTISDLFLKLCSENFCPLTGKITCGGLTSSISLYPHLTLNRNELYQESLEISICGFMKINDIASPPVYSKHLVLPTAGTIEDFRKWMSCFNQKADMTDDELIKLFADEGRQPNFGVLLHGAFKCEGTVALCQLSDTWFGILYSGTDNTKKKSCLMLSTFEPGLDSIPWVSKFANLGIPKSDNDAARATSIKKPSNYVVWLHDNAIQTDVQVRVISPPASLFEEY